LNYHFSLFLLSFRQFFQAWNQIKVITESLIHQAFLLILKLAFKFIHIHFLFILRLTYILSLILAKVIKCISSIQNVFILLFLNFINSYDGLFIINWSTRWLIFYILNQDIFIFVFWFVIIVLSKSTNVRMVSSIILFLYTYLVWKFQLVEISQKARQLLFLICWRLLFIYWWATQIVTLIHVIWSMAAKIGTFASFVLKIIHFLLIRLFLVRHVLVKAQLQEVIKYISILIINFLIFCKLSVFLLIVN